MNDWRGEGLRPKKKKKGTAGECPSKGSSIAGNLVVDDRVEVGYRCKVSKEHVDKGVVALLVSFAACAHASMGKIKFKDKVCKVM